MLLDVEVSCLVMTCNNKKKVLEHYRDMVDCFHSGDGTNFKLLKWFCRTFPKSHAKDKKVRQKTFLKIESR